MFSFGEQPNVHQLKVFGCLCISKIEVFAGYDGSSSGYILYHFLKKKFYHSRKANFHKEQFPGLNNGSRPAIVLLFLGNYPVGAVTDSVGVNNLQTSAINAYEILPFLEQPLSPTGELLLQLLILLKEYLQHLVLIICKWRFKILQTT